MIKMTGYESVDAARARGDLEELSRLGKKGADSRRNIRKRIPSLTLVRLAGAVEAQKQAHEDVCPLND